MTDETARVFTIRPLHDWDEYLACEELQAKVWEMPDYRELVPAALLKVAQENGGVLLGAFDGNSQLIGFVFGIVGVEEHMGTLRLKHHSHMLAVKSEWRRTGLGLALKLAQRDQLVAQGIGLATWTFDPLQALNARLNLVRLGVIARRYLVNAYGEMANGLNAGMPSDRFEVEWWVNSPRVRACVERRIEPEEWDASREVFDVRENSRGGLEIRALNEISPDRALVEIPADLNALKHSDLPLAQDWRMRSRDVFLRAFAQGLVVTGFAEKEMGKQKRTAYVLTHLTPSPHMSIMSLP